MYKKKFKVLQEKFYDDNLRLLSIFDLLIECTEKYKAYKSPLLYNLNEETLKYELEKKLMDLLILLTIERKHGEGMHRTFLNRINLLFYGTFTEEEIEDMQKLSEEKKDIEYIFDKNL